MPTLHGHFSVFNEWTEIDGWEGNFLERVAPGAFAHTLAHDRSRIRVLFQHGRDPQLGAKPLGVPTTLREDELGGYYEVPLLDTSYNRELVPGLRAGVYGASFRFTVTREHLLRSPEASSYNPKGLPERTIQEARVLELGPVSFPAYDGATAGVRSLTDWYISTLEAAA
jgi:HK97 family phage prohead protease